MRIKPPMGGIEKWSLLLAVGVPTCWGINVLGNRLVEKQERKRSVSFDGQTGVWTPEQGDFLDTGGAADAGGDCHGGH
jgi:hypothetical protein